MNVTSKEFINILNKYQTRLENNLNKKNTRLIYKNDVGAVVNDFINELYQNKLLNELYKYKLEKDYQTTEFSIVIESIAKLLSNKVIHNLDIKTRLFVYNKYPILIYNLLLDSNINKIKPILKQLLDECPRYKFVGMTPIRVNLDYLNDYCNNFDSILKNNSALCIFNNFYGINFKKVGINYKDLPTTNNIIINIGYNFNSPQDNVVYTSSKQYTKFFLDEDILDQFQFMTKIKIQPKSELYKLNKKNDGLFSIIINYNNSIDDKECYYSITDSVFSYEQINNLLNGGLLIGFSKISYDIYVSVLFYSYINKVDKNKIDMSATMTKIYPCIKSFYNINPKPVIEKWSIWGDREFKTDLERKMFKIYLDKLYQLMDEENKLDYFKYISHISNYFIIEVTES